MARWRGRERGRWRGPLPDRCRVRGPDGADVLLRFRAVGLWEVPVARAFAGATPRSPGLLPFTAFLAGATPAHVERAIELLLRCRLARARRVSLAVAAAIFGERVFSDRSWRDILDEEVVMKSALVDAWRAEGRVEGRAEGRGEAAQAMLLRFVRGKLGRLPRGLRAAVGRSHDVDTLEDLAEEVARARDAAAVREALARALGRL